MPGDCVLNVEAGSEPAPTLPHFDHIHMINDPLGSRAFRGDYEGYCSLNPIYLMSFVLCREAVVFCCVKL